MPWRTMRLRRQKVLARCDEAGALLAENGRVEIRYRPKDGRAYRAAQRNLEPGGDPTIFPDDHCAEAEPAPGREEKSPKKPRVGAEVGEGGAPVAPEVPGEGEILVYADGACSGNPGPAGLGVVMLFGSVRRELSEYLGHGTNNIAELTAIMRAAEAVENAATPLRLYTDSSYAIGLLTKGWKAKKNKELVAEVRAAFGRLEDAELHHVRGHAGVPLNERADALAVQAVETRESTGWLVVDQEP